MEYVLEKGRPKGGRLEKEMRLYDLLDALDIRYERVDHEAARTMEDCLEIDKVLAPAVICKNLFLCNAQKTKFYLLMIRDDKKFKTKEISHQIGSARLSFAPAEFMEKYLDIVPGSVSVMGLMNDKENNVELLEDNFYNLQEQYADIEDVDMADALTSFVWAQYCYNAALKVGNSVLSESLMDYLK